MDRRIVGCNPFTVRRAARASQRTSRRPGELAGAQCPDETGDIARQAATFVRAGLALAVLVGSSSCASRDKTGNETTVSPPGTSATTSVPATTTEAPATTAATAPTTPPTSGSPAPTTGAAAAITQITENWETFFHAGTPLAEREALLEDGAQYEEALTIRSSDPLQAQASAVVRSVTLTDATHAHVVYDVILGETVALPAAEGNAVLQDGTWKVSAESFCSLIALGASEPIPGCS